MKTSQPTIVDMEELVQLRKFCRWWAVGWVVGALGFGLAGVALGVTIVEVNFVQKERERLNDTAALLQETTALQNKETQRFTEAWQLQHNTTELLIGWGSYVNERADVAKTNVAMAPVSRPNRKKEE